MMSFSYIVYASSIPRYLNLYLPPCTVNDAKKSIFSRSFRPKFDNICECVFVSGCVSMRVAAWNILLSYELEKLARVSPRNKFCNIL